MYEINSKWIKDRNLRAQPTKFLEEYIRENLHGNDFLIMTAKHRLHPNPRIKIRFHHNEKLVCIKVNYQEGENKKTHSMGESMCKSYYLIRDFYPEYICKGLLQPNNNNKIKQPN